MIILMGNKMEKVDFSKVKKGDIICFRDGSRTIALDNCILDKNPSFYSVKIDMPNGQYYTISRTKHGSFELEKYNRLDNKDVVEIIPCPFNWSNVKRGMAFIISKHLYHQLYSRILYYVGDDIHDKKRCVFQDQNGTLHSLDRSELEYFPTRDLKI